MYRKNIMRHFHAAVVLYKAADTVHAVAQGHGAAGGIGIADDGIDRFSAQRIKGCLLYTSSCV